MHYVPKVCGMYINVLLLFMICKFFARHWPFQYQHFAAIFHVPVQRTAVDTSTTKHKRPKNFHSRFCVFDGQSRQNTRCWANEWNCARLEYELRTILIEKNRAMSTFKLEQSVAFIWISAFFFLFDVKNQKLFLIGSAVSMAAAIV